jgi:hypothetical protein
MEAPAQVNSQELEPFGYFGYASAIRPLGGEERGPDPRYVFHTSYFEFRRGRVIFTVQFEKLRATFGELRVQIHAFVPGSGRDAVFVTSSRLDLTDQMAIERGLAISFVCVAGARYAAYGYCPEGTDAQASGLIITAEEIDTPGEGGGDNVLLPTRLETPDLVLPGRLVGDEPPLFRDPVSQVVTADQLAEPECQYWLERLPNRPADDAVGWRFAFIAQVLERYGMLRHGARGLTLGGGGVALGPTLAAAGCEALVGTLPHNHGASDFAWSDLSCRQLDAAGVPHGEGEPLALATESADRRGFDFMWTIGMAQLGYQAGHCGNFLCELMTVLRPGGFAVHMLDLAPPWQEATDSLPRREVERLAVTLISRGFTVAQLNFGPANPAAAMPFGLIVRKD